MSQETTLLEKIAASPSLQEALEKLSGETSATEVQKLAEAHGVSLSEEEATALIPADSELSDDDLETVNGGIGGGLGQSLRDLEARVNNDIANLNSRYPSMVKIPGKPQS